MAARGGTFQIPGGSGVVTIDYFNTSSVNFRVPFKDGGEVFRIRMGRGTPAEAYPEIELIPQIVFPEGSPGFGEGVVPLLAECCVAAGMMITHLEGV